MTTLTPDRTEPKPRSRRNERSKQASAKQPSTKQPKGRQPTTTQARTGRVSAGRAEGTRARSRIGRVRIADLVALPARARRRGAAPEGSAIENPRIAARRRRVEEAERRRKRRLMFAPVIVLGVVAAVAAVLFSPLTAVENVTVRGTERVVADDVLGAGGLRIGMPMARMDEGDLAQALVALPWVASVDIARHWPHDVVVTVTERRPVARLAADGVDVAVDRFGRVLGVPPTGAGLIPVRIAGPLPTPGAELDGDVASAVSVIDQFGERVRAAVSGVRVAEDGSLTFELGDAAVENVEGATVRFGAPTEVPAKLLAVESFLGGGVDLSSLEVLDVTEPAHVVLAREGAIAAASEAARSADSAAGAGAGDTTTPTTTPSKSTPSKSTTSKSTTTTPTTTKSTTSKSTTTTIASKQRSTSTVKTTTTTTKPTTRATTKATTTVVATTRNALPAAVDGENE